MNGVQRRYWSGPNRYERRIPGLFAVRAKQLSMAPRSVSDGRYPTRQRNRQRKQR